MAMREKFPLKIEKGDVVDMLWATNILRPQPNYIFV